MRRVGGRPAHMDLLLPVCDPWALYDISTDDDDDDGTIQIAVVTLINTMLLPMSMPITMIAWSPLYGNHLRTQLGIAVHRQHLLPTHPPPEIGNTKNIITINHRL